MAGIIIGTIFSIPIITSIYYFVMKAAVRNVLNEKEKEKSKIEFSEGYILFIKSLESERTNIFSENTTQEVKWEKWFKRLATLNLKNDDFENAVILINTQEQAQRDSENQDIDEKSET
ncbi:hypothetical protein [[Acholeplasma] multilocale]|uniref:hypothetical protein n=1 Tax=[Acholeplasma] multilocale TaxID=264638 RepID=UPI00047A00AD|nr:hypothetical protein [[Acholeplasma] multilocale]